ncbi:diguanylate cyclase [Chitinibacter bivalviorum]|uniref:diguanylate cyclase n=1 Tax=Chitinibacter bivalviorum TaxID=2739434 RepID=A0A7H9BKE1_9NEIS|nr:diguanylate cyclase [Chitinibacter bivalviorum]QLG89145.1 diguanylate cyclase [Chitinibacter bivalviorum]
MRLPRFQSITRLIIQQIVLVSVLCATLVGAIHAYMIYRQSEHQYHDTLDAIATVYVPQLALAIWDIEPTSIQSALRGMVDLNDEIGFVQLDLLAGRHFEYGSRQRAGNLPAHSFRILEPGTSNHIIGHLAVYPDSAVLYRMLLINVGLSSLGYVILVTLICQLVRIILRRHLREPLKEIASFARDLDAEKLLVPLQLSHRDNVIPNEIDMVVAGFDVLQAELSRHIHHLDALVKARTEALEEALASISQLSITDPLTGCYNRHYLNNQLEHLFADEAAAPVSLIFCDIVFFKRVNDEFGHKAGDEVLSAVGQVLRQGLRDDSDWVARYGGEEFLIILPRTDLEQAQHIAERLLEEIRALSFQFRAQHFQITASFGVAQQRLQESASQLCERADQLLYEAKHTGRNRVCGENWAEHRVGRGA